MSRHPLGKIRFTARRKKPAELTATTYDSEASDVRHHKPERIKNRFLRSNRVFTYCPTHRTPDCEMVAGEGILWHGIKIGAQFV
jgi:hypothetical protein